MKYYLFLDETGDHGLSYIDDNFPLFLLSGVFISEEEYSVLSKDINDFKHKFFNTTEVILHSRDIRKVEGPFQILFNLKIKKHFYEDINRILGNTNYKIFGAGIDKRKHIEKYGKTAHDPYSTSLSFLIERLIFECDDTDRCSEVNIVIEKRGKREDALLLAHYNTIIDGAGTFYVSAQRIKAKIKSFDFKNKKDNDIGLQAADLCAYPIARNILNPKEPSPAFEVIKGKIRNMQKGKTGVKVFP